MVLNIESLLAPVPGEDRAGPDLAYDQQRHEIEQVFDASVSIDANGETTTAADIDWRHIISLIAEQSVRTKDIWLAVYLCRAGARSGRLDVVETGARYLAGLIERFWEDGHPRLAEYGIEGRTGACDTLASFREFTGPLRSIVLLNHPRHGSFTGEDLQRFNRGREAETGYGAFRAVMEEDTSLACLVQAVTQLETIEALFRDVDAALAERAGVGAGTSFAPVYEALAGVRDAARAFLPEAEVVETVEGVVQEGELNAVDARRITGAVTSRADVARVLDLVIEYYVRNEPHSPMPLLLGRAREWINRDFMELLSDIAPGALPEASALLNFRTAIK